MKEPERPDPDALLRRVQADEAKEKRARLKLFFLCLLFQTFLQLLHLPQRLSPKQF